MDQRTIGSLEASVVGLGTDNFGFIMEEEAVSPVVDAALDAGINFFDTSDSYVNSEERLGKALGKQHDEVLIATKFGSPVKGEAGTGGAKPAYLRRALERSLRELGTDRIDLYQLHRPDPATPIADTLEVLADLVAEGKVREIGCSNFSAAQIEEAEAAVAEGAPRFVSVQNEYNLLDRSDEAEAIPTCIRHGLAYLPYYPLASGVLTGKYQRGTPPAPGTRLDQWGSGDALRDENFDLIDALSAFAIDRGHSLLELAVAWLIAKPPVASVIAGATRPEQARANAAAAAWRLSAEEVAAIDDLTASRVKG